MAATADSWKRVPFTTGVPLTYAPRFTSEQYGKLCEGLVPAEMEDKWFIYFDAPYLFFHRSWTGQPVYRITLSEHGGTATVTEALWASELADGKIDEASYQGRLLDFLVANLLLGQAKPFPMPTGLAEKHPGILQHHVAGTGYPQSVPKEKKRWWQFWK